MRTVGKTHQRGFLSMLALQYLTAIVAVAAAGFLSFIR